MKNPIILSVLMTLMTTIEVFPASALAQNCSILASLKESLSELETLSSGAALSESYLESHSTREVAKAVVQRLAKRISAQNKTRVNYPLWRESELMLFFNPELAEKNAKDGFLNFFQTGYSTAFSSRELRVGAENRLFDLQLKDVADHHSAINELRPKYMYLNLTAPVDLGSHTADARIYGQSKSHAPSAAIVFKDEVKARTTWTDSDSLLVSADPNHYGTFFEDSLPVGPRRGDSYFEGQTLGPLNASDGSHILLFEDIMAWPSENQAALEQLKALSLPIYKGKAEFNFSRYIYRREGLLWSPAHP